MICVVKRLHNLPDPAQFRAGFGVFFLYLFRLLFLRSALPKNALRNFNRFFFFVSCAMRCCLVSQKWNKKPHRRAHSFWGLSIMMIIGIVNRFILYPNLYAPPSFLLFLTLSAIRLAICFCSFHFDFDFNFNFIAFWMLLFSLDSYYNNVSSRGRGCM